MRDVLTYPVLDLAMPYGVVDAVSCPSSAIISVFCLAHLVVPGPLPAVKASSPMKKSRSSVPRLPERCPPGPAPPVKKEGLLATAGLPEPELPAPPAGPLVAMAVGNTKEGESFPAKPRRGCQRKAM